MQNTLGSANEVCVNEPGHFCHCGPDPAATPSWGAILMAARGDKFPASVLARRPRRMHCTA